MTRNWLRTVAAGALLAFAATPATAQDLPKITLAMSGWTGFAPLSLAEQEGLFEQHGVEVEIVFIPQTERHLAMAAGDVQAIATTVDTHISYTAAGVPLTQVLILDKSKGGDGIAARADIQSVEDLKGQQIAVEGAGSTPYFFLMAVFEEHGLTADDISTANLKPKDAALAFVAGQYDAAVTYEPYLSQVRENPDAGKILVTTVDYPVIVDTVAFQPQFIEENPEIVEGVIRGYLDALEMIRTDQDHAFEVIGAVVKQTGEQFAGSAQYIEWQDLEANQRFFAEEMAPFLEMAAGIQSEAGVIREIPDLAQLADGSFVEALE